MTDEAWVLGASGRTGRGVAARLHEADVPLVLVGRDRDRLEGVAAELGGAPRLVVGPLPFALDELARAEPAVVVNTVGPFTTTAPQVVRACPPATHYVDVANEFRAVEAVLDLDRHAAARNQVLVTGAGFGVLATESVVLRLCHGEPPPARVRVDALASVAIDAGVVGPALAATVVEILAFGGWQVRGGRLVRARLAGDPVRLTTPGGEERVTVSGPSGELLAAWRASRADTVVAASSEVPTGALVRSVVPALSALLRVPALGRLAGRGLARVPLRAAEQPRPYSWAHARVEWPSGTVREGWLRTGEGTAVTTATAAEVAQRLIRGEGTPGAHTPGALFGPELSEAVGGEFLVDHGPAPSTST